MVTITIKFDYDGNKQTLKACLKNDMMTLSESKQNQATDLIEDAGDDDRWSLVFDTDGDEMYEVVMYRDADGEKTTEAEYVIVWGGTGKDAILAEIDVKSSCKRS